MQKLRWCQAKTWTTIKKAPVLKEKKQKKKVSCGEKAKIMIGYLQFFFFLEKKL